MESLYVKSFHVNHDLTLFRQSYLSKIPALKNLKDFTFCNRVAFFAGENGTGKSTLLEALAVASGFNPEGGTKNFNFSSRETHSPLFECLRLVRGPYRPRDGFFLRAESFYNVASYIDDLDTQAAASRPIIDSYGGVSLHRQSHGESFFSLMENRFGGHGLYILDEPEAALSPNRQIQMLCLLDRLVKSDSQFIIATHSPILMAYPGADIYVLSECGAVLTPYKETEHYLLTKSFLNKPEKTLEYLLSGEINESF